MELRNHPGRIGSNQQATSNAPRRVRADPPTAIRRNIENGDLLQRRENHLCPFAGKGLTEDELKRLDKATTVMKVGVKMVKKVLRARVIGGRLKPEAADACAAARPEQS